MNRAELEAADEFLVFAGRSLVQVGVRPRYYIGHTDTLQAAILLAMPHELEGKQIRIWARSGEDTLVEALGTTLFVPHNEHAAVEHGPCDGTRCDAYVPAGGGHLVHCVGCDDDWPHRKKTESCRHCGEAWPCPTRQDADEIVDALGGPWWPGPQERGRLMAAGRLRAAV